MVADTAMLFTRPELWQTDLHRMQVMKLSFFFLQHLSDAQLRAADRMLRHNGIALAIEAPMQVPGSRGCGLGVEGYQPKGMILGLISRLKRLGVALRYAAMDEPLWFGHFAPSFWLPSAGVCHASISAVAENVASVVASVRQKYPDIIVGDIEPLSAIYKSGASTSDDLISWARAFHSATGRPLAFVHFDIVWANAVGIDPDSLIGLAPQLADYASTLHKFGLRWGVIYNGSVQDGTDSDWVAHACFRFQMVEGSKNSAGLELHPDDAIIESWNPRPSRVLPETMPNTLTNLLLRYSQWHSELLNSSSYAFKAAVRSSYRRGTAVQGSNWFWLPNNSEQKAVSPHLRWLYRGRSGK